MRAEGVSMRERIPIKRSLPLTRLDGGKIAQFYGVIQRLS